MADPTPITLPIGGMTCAACQSHVEKALRGRPGVHDVTVNLVTRSAHLTIDPAMADVAALVAAVDDAGYHAEAPLPDDDVIARQLADDRERRREVRGWAVRAAVSLAAMGGVMIAAAPLPHGHDRLAHALAPPMTDAARALAPGLWAIAPTTLAIALLVVTAAIAGLAGWPIWRAGVRVAGPPGPGDGRAGDPGRRAAMAISVAYVAGAGGGFYAEGVLGILGFVAVGRAIEAAARRRTTSALDALARLVAPRARIVDDDGGERELATADLRRGDLLVIRPGERIAADAVIEDRGHRGRRGPGHRRGGAGAARRRAAAAWPARSTVRARCGRKVEAAAGASTVAQA
jgi:Cu+-exporting ATPase